MRTLLLSLLLLPFSLAAQYTFEASHSDGNIAGRFYDVATLPNDVIVGAGQHSVPTLVAYQPDGQVLWKRTFANNQVNHFSFYSLRPAHGGGLVAYGIGKNPTTGDANDPFIMRTDNSGQPLWAKIYSGAHQELFTGGIRATMDGGYIGCGESIDANNNVARYFMIKADSAGNRVWGNHYQAPIPVKASLFDVYEDENGDYYASGSLHDSAVVMKVSHTGAFSWLKFVYPQGATFSFVRSMAPSHTPGRFVCTGYVMGRSFIFEMDTLGSISWGNFYDNIANFDICRSPGGGYTAAGNSMIALNGILMHVDNNGQSPWCRVLTSCERLYAVDTLYNGNGYAVGGEHFASNVTAYLARTDTAGKLYCSETSLSLWVNPANITLIPGTMIVTSYFTASPFAVPQEEYTAGHSVLCLHIGMAPEPGTDALAAWPVPADEKLFLELPDEAQWLITLSDALGRTALQKNLRGRKQELDLVALPPGIYWLRAESGEKIVTKKILRR